MARVISTPSRSLGEYRLLPGFTDIHADPPSVSLSAPLCRSGEAEALVLGLPFVGAAMQAVTGVEMAISLAQLGGIGVLPVSQTIEAQCAGVDAVKRFKAGFQTELVTLAPGQKLSELSALMVDTGYSRFPVTDTGLFHGHLLGVISDKDFDPSSDGDACVADRMRKDVQVGVEIEDLAEANRLMVDYGRGFLPIVSREGTLLSVVFKKDRDKHMRHPHESVDSERRLRVAAAVSTHPEDRERAAALLEYEADVLVVDASHGHTQFQCDALAWIKSRTSTPVVAGNVVTREGFEALAAAGADGVKVGMGIGSGCTTQSVRAAGRGQATALREVAEARDRHADASGVYLPIVADGGLSGPAPIAVALALGADTVMLGNLLARFSESPGALERGAGGEMWKEYWMEGSRRAHSERRYAQTAKTFFEEGIEGRVPHAGSIYEGLPQLAAMLRAAVSTAGCRNLAGLHADAVLELQSERCLADAAVHGMQPVQRGGSVSL